MDMAVTKKFNQNIIGFPLAIDTTELIIFAAGSVFIGFRPVRTGDMKYALFSHFEAGLDHIAIPVKVKINYTVLQKNLPMQVLKKQG
jgi:hypothetical protein